MLHNAFDLKDLRKSPLNQLEKFLETLKVIIAFELTSSGGLFLSGIVVMPLKLKSLIIIEYEKA